jgi:hypothetical protein
VNGRYPSRKTGVTVQFESHRVELVFIYDMEHTMGNTVYDASREYKSVLVAGNASPDIKVDSQIITLPNGNLMV